MGKLAKGVLGFLRREVVLSAAIVLAAASAFLVPPDAQYFSYIDWDTLALLFGLMAVMQGFQKAGLFVFLGSRLLRRAATVRGMLFVLVFLPFVSSMVITNDVSLITFVPFGITVLRMAGKEKLLVPMAVLQTAAANLGSMLTPMGNPQNLYLYTRSAMGFGEFCWLMLPYTAVSALCLAALVWCRKREPVSGAPAAAPAPSLRSLLPAAAGFLLCLLALFDLLPAIGVAAVDAALDCAFEPPPPGPGRLLLTGHLCRLLYFYRQPGPPGELPGLPLLHPGRPGGGGGGAGQPGHQQCACGPAPLRLYPGLACPDRGLQPGRAGDPHRLDGQPDFL